jgi:hypothetical protein
MITMNNHSTVLACYLYEEVRGDRDAGEYRTLGVVLAEYRDEYVTWTVVKQAGADGFDAYNGRYFSTKRLAATVDFENRVNDERESQARVQRTTVVMGLGKPEPAFKRGMAAPSRNRCDIVMGEERCVKERHHLGRCSFPSDAKVDA